MQENATPSERDEFGTAFSTASAEGRAPAEASPQTAKDAEVPEAKTLEPQAGPEEKPAPEAAEPVRQEQERDEPADEPDYKELYEREVQRRKSLEGRFRKERERFERERAESAESAAGPQGQSRPSVPDESEQALDEFRRAHPELESPLKLLAKLEAERAVRPLIESMEAERHLRTISRAHPDWRDIAASNDLAAWIDEQPDYIAASLHEVLERGHAQQVVDLIDRYKRDRGEKTRQEAAGREKRRRRAMAEDAEAVPARTAGPPRPAPAAEDFKGAWSEAAKTSRAAG